MKYILAVLVLCLSAFIYFFIQQDSDLVLRFYQSFGPEPCSVLRGKVVWITGASTGIGRQLAYDLASCGCKLVLSARRKQKLQEVKEKCAEINPSYQDDDVIVLPLDVTSFSSHADLSSHVIGKFGRIDILVNNAGVASMFYPTEIRDFRVENQVIQTNLMGTISLTKAVVPHMLKKGQGQIVLVSSMYGKFVAQGVADYCASKFGAQAYLNSLRYEVSPRNITIVTVMSGPVVSDMEISALYNVDNVTAKDSPDFQKFMEFFKDWDHMPTERFSQLMMLAMVNNLKEAWISTRHNLNLAYLAHYFNFV